jgi:hypothetical protein
MLASIRRTGEVRAVRGLSALVDDPELRITR